MSDGSGRAIEVQPGVVALRCPFRSGTNEVSVLILEGAELALVDTGVAETLAEVIEPALRARGRALGDVRTVVLTHADGDHAGSLPAIHQASAPGVLAHPEAALRVSMPDLQPVADGERFEAGGIAFV